MENQGILRRIRELLNEGRTTTEVIARGFAPGSVYKARRQLLRQVSTPVSDHPMAPVPRSNPIAWTAGQQELLPMPTAQVMSLREEIAGLEEDRTELRHEHDFIERLLGTEREDHERELSTLQGELEQKRTKVNALEAELTRLRPLEAWAGHPCAICDEPLAGIVEPAVAREITKRLAHQACIDKQREKPLVFEFLNRELPAS